jgi:hypothetical protein
MSEDGVPAAGMFLISALIIQNLRMLTQEQREILFTIAGLIQILVWTHIISWTISLVTYVWTEVTRGFQYWPWSVIMAALFLLFYWTYVQIKNYRKKIPLGEVKRPRIVLSGREPSI